MAPADPNEPYFLLNEFLNEDKKYLDEVAETLQQSHPSWEEKAIFLRTFTEELYKAHCRQKTQQAQARIKHERELLEQKKRQHDLLLKKKQELIQRIEQLKTQQAQAAASPSVEPLAPLRKPEQPPQPTPPHTTPPRSPQPQDPSATITSFLNDPTINTIVCPGAQQPITITKGENETLTEIQFASDEALNIFLQNIATQLNQSVSQENPFLNAQLDTHTHIQANITTPYLKAKFAIIKD